MKLPYSNKSESINQHMYGLPIWQGSISTISLNLPKILLVLFNERQYNSIVLLFNAMYIRFHIILYPSPIKFSLALLLSPEHGLIKNSNVRNKIQIWLPVRCRICVFIHEGKKKRSPARSRQ